MATGDPRRTRPAARRGRRLELRPAELRRRLDPARLSFATTADVPPLVGTIGQPRALAAIGVGLETTTRGFNVFVAGTPGSGRSNTVLDYLRTHPTCRRPPDDWVYVHDFRNPDRPNAIRLPAGRGSELARSMDEFLEAARREIPRAFESEEYESRQRELMAQIADERRQLEEALHLFATEHGYALQATITGMVSIPLVHGEPITREAFAQLDRDEQRSIEERGREVEDHVAVYAHQLHQLEKEAARRLRDLEQEVALFAVGPLLRELEERFANEPEVVAHIADMRQELLVSISDFHDGTAQLLPMPLGPQVADRMARFRVNALVDNADSTGPPVVVEVNPTYYNLVGRIEYRAAFGAMVTDFREIQAGALHRANGGTLVLDALEVLRHPFAWDALKRALQTGEVRIENLGMEYSAVPSATLRPESIPLDVKVVLIGTPWTYALLHRFDDEFRELFKVKAEFARELPWNAGSQRDYASFVRRCVDERGLRHFDRAAVAAVIEHGARLREDRRKLSTRLGEIADVASEASFWAEQEGHDIVEADDVRKALRQREYRFNLLEERVQELIHDGTLVIETDGTRVGTVNGLALLDLGDHAFGTPTRVSARVALGRGGVASIERETELSGAIHSKGVLIVAGYLAGTHAQEVPLALSATLTFEQTYDEIDGDSASSAELYALLSALSDLPLDQGIAATGSVDQHGNVQAVGGVTRKIEGFYATCKAKGLTGRQGVIIPAANLRSLMLDHEIVEAAEAGRFHVWAVRTIDEGIELLAGTPAGRKRRDGSYPADSVHGLVAERLAAYVERLREIGEEPGDGGTKGAPRTFR